MRRFFANFAERDLRYPTIFKTMKILHTSDWHLGATLYGHDRSVDQAYMLHQIADIVSAEQPDAVLVSGDVFDNGTPTAASQAMLAEGLMNILDRGKGDMRVILTSGNHDSPSRHVANSTVYERVRVHTVGSSRITSESAVADLYNELVITLPGKGVVVAVPYINERNLPKEFYKLLLEEVKINNTAGLPVVMMAHLTVADSLFTGHDSSDDRIVGGIESVTLEGLGEGYDYLALGHIHCPQQWTHGKATVRYCGTPCAVSFSEEYEHSVTIAEVAAGNCEVRTVPLVANHPLVTIGGAAGLSEDELKAALVRECSADGDFSIPPGAYLRFNLALEEGQLYPDTFAADHLADACRTCGVVFCNLNPVRAVATSGVGEIRQLTVNEMRNMSPEALVEEYAAKRGCVWTAELQALLAEATARAENEQQALI